jgi:hypothetical protein
MPTSYTNNLGLALPVQGELAGTWGDVVNTEITGLLDSAIAGTTTLSSDADVTLTDTTGAANQSRQAILLWTANGTATRTITAPARTKAYIVINASAGTQSIKLVGAGPTTGITVAAGERCVAAWNGSDFVKVASSVPDGVTSVALSAPTGLTVSGSPVTSSGTLALSLTAGYSIPTTSSQSNWDAAYTQRLQWDGGSTNLVASTGRTSLGGTTVGQNFFTLTNPGAITFPRINADNTVSALSAADFRTAIGAGTGGGSVTSVGGTGTVNGITLSGTVTSTGNLTLGGTLSDVSLTTQVTGRLPVANGGTGAATLTGLVKGNGTSAFTAAAAGTDYAPATSGTSILYGNGAGGFSNVTLGSGISFSGGTLSATGSGGTLTAVTASAPLASSGGSAPNISLTGAVAVANGGTGATNAATARSNLSVPSTDGTGASGTWGINITGNANYANSAGSASSATSATTASTANALNTGNSYQVSSLGVGTAASGTAGEIRATNNITAYYSDDRLKTRLGQIEGALEKVCSLTGFYYEANETAQALGYKAVREVGLSAQDLQAALPEVVAPAPIDDKYLTVRYERVIPLLVEAIKELRAELAAMKGAC